MAKVKNKKISDYTFDTKNINKGSEFGSMLLEKSIRDYGLGRSMLADKNGVMIAGNKTLAKAGELGMEKVVEIETDGTELIIVKRKDLSIDSDAGTKLKILDNTVSKHNYVEDAEIVEVICEEYQIENPVALGLGEFDENKKGPEGVSFTASNKPVIKIQFATLAQLLEAEEEIQEMIKDQYPGAIVTVKGKP